MAIILNTVPSESFSSQIKKTGIEPKFTTQTVFQSTYTTLDSLKSALVNYFSTYKGERYLNPDVGSNLFGYLFSNQGELSNEQINSLQTQLLEELERKFPELEISDALFIIDESQQSLNISLTFNLKNTNISDSLTFNINL